MIHILLGLLSSRTRFREDTQQQLCLQLNMYIQIKNSQTDSFQAIERYIEQSQMSQRAESIEWRKLQKNHEWENARWVGTGQPRDGSCQANIDKHIICMQTKYQTPCGVTMTEKGANIYYREYVPYGLTKWTKLATWTSLFTLLFAADNSTIFKHFARQRAPVNPVQCHTTRLRLQTTKNK